MTDKMSIIEAAHHFGVSEKTIRRWIDSGKLQAEKQGKVWVISVQNGVGQNDQNGLIDQLLKENNHLRDQLTKKDEQIDHLTQLLALKEKNVAALTEQIDTQRTVIEDMRRPWWQRVFRRHHP